MDVTDFVTDSLYEEERSSQNTWIYSKNECILNGMQEESQAMGIELEELEAQLKHEQDNIDTRMKEQGGIHNNKEKI